ncbi:MAG: EAL domain-containing protein [Magnetococcales bacterium]|nr:EAL domain-containing protein [Magnetococcales bacterium]
MSRAKDAGRDNCQFYTAAMSEQATHRITLEARMRRALVEEHFLLYFQPKVDTMTQRITGMEALVRWREADGRVVSPGEFIPLAEETGLIVPLGEWIFNNACRQMRNWLELLDPNEAPIRVAINLSTRQFRQKGLPQMIAKALKESDLPAHYVELEITESMVMDDVDEAIVVLNELKEMGLHISVDDFGAGYSSLNYLKRFPIHALKIDQSFVRDLASDADDAAIVSAIISMAHSLHLAVIAEGVETEQQMKFLQQKGCEQLQGFLFSQPVPPENFQKLLINGHCG